jgi:hypothetical protein
MTDELTGHTALGDVAARQLANATKTVPQMSSITPRWLVHCLQWIPVEAGIFRLNRVKDGASVAVECSGRDEQVLPKLRVEATVDAPLPYGTRGILNGRSARTQAALKRSSDRLSCMAVTGCPAIRVFSTDRA